MKRLGVAFNQIGDLAGVANGSDYAIAAREQLIGEFTAEAAADAGDKPCAL
ncbi:MAG: hypothetical protein ABSF49_17140 [Roseiarcus sp.]|uniref:hypothetical protein n=1 Tax=Roseiarcus sp. TaxID=1969460 RepID=UPI003C1799CB